MSHRTKLSRLVLATLAVASIAAPSAFAGPTDPVGTGFQDQQTTPDARGESAAGGGPAAGGPIRQPRVQAAPTWPTHPTPLPRLAQPPLAADGGDDVDLPVVLLVIAGTLALGGGLAVATSKVRAHTREAH
jgi:hypothetical protein